MKLRAAWPEYPVICWLLLHPTREYFPTTPPREDIPS